MKIDQFRRLEFPEVRVLEASAGSGKTYALAQRYIQLLLNPNASPQEIRNILAITFTNMATREMKERILEFIKKIALGKFANQEEKNELLAHLPADEQLVRRKAFALMDYIVKNYNYFQVQTIDSFINIVLKGCAYRLGLSASFKIKSDYREHLLYSLEECIQRANSERGVRRIFENFLEQYIYLEGKKGWYPKLDILKLIGSLLHESNLSGKKFEKFEIKSQELIAEKREILAILKKLRERLPCGTNARFKSSLEKFLNQHEEGFDFRDLRSRYFLSREFPLNKGCVLPPDVKELWERLLSRLAEVAEKEARSLFNCYIEIFDLVYQVFRNRASSEDVLFLEELNQQALTLFGEEMVSVPELYYRLATRFKHYLIDEFQDTSTLQWQNLFLMIEDALSQGGSFFYVGDKKQAIYRFRGGEVMLFDKIKLDFKRFNVKVSPLNVNFRSQKEIVEFNNIVFSPQNLMRFLKEQNELQSPLKKLSPQELKEIVAVFEDSQQSYRKENSYGYVKIELLEEENREEQKEILRTKLLSLIQELNQRFQLKDIALLLRRNQEVELISSWLIQNNIAVESEKTLDIRNNYLIKELVSFLKFLHSPIDNLSFVSFILGEIFARASALSREEVEEFIFQERGKLLEGKPYYIYRSFRKRFPQIWESYLDEFFKLVGLIDPYQLTVRIIQKFKVLENFESYQGFFMHFLELIEMKEEEYFGLGDFLEYFESSGEDVFYVHSSETDAVKVMSIHKAKGLGFPVVIIPFLDLKIEPGSSGNRSKHPYQVYPQGEKLSLLRLDTKYTNFSSQIRDAYRQEYKRAFIDELNTIYVAFTRAKYELYIFIPHLSSGKRSGSKNLAKLLIPEECYQKGKRHSYQLKELESATFSFSLPVCEYREWSNYLVEEFASIERMKKREKILRGEILHFILSNIGNLAGINTEEVLQKAILEAKLRFPTFDNFSELKTIIEKMLQTPELKRFFYLKEGIVYQEKELVNSRGESRRVDRLILTEKEVWVIDYKSSQELISDYRLQLQEYIDLLKELYPEKRIRGYIIFLDSREMEEVA